MYQFRIVTLFPELFSGFTEASLIGKAVQNGLLSFEYVNLRDFTHDRHRTVDDSPYGGGAGMVMKTEPILEALSAQPPSRKVLLTPQGQTFSQKDAVFLAAEEKPLLLFCGRYEGVDERVREKFDAQYSIGDFVLNGGETAAMVIIEAVSRLLPGVIGKMASTVEESFSAGLLEYPQYTRPEEIDGRKVPEVLLSGNHKKIEEWRRGQALLRTSLVRPDLFARYEMTDRERELYDEAKAEAKKK